MGDPLPELSRPPVTWGLPSDNILCSSFCPRSTPLVRLPALLGLSLFLARALPGGHVPAAERPHIAFILADDMGFGDIRALNGKSTIPTPTSIGWRRRG